MGYEGEEKFIIERSIGCKNSPSMRKWRAEKCRPLHFGVEQPHEGLYNP